MTAIIWAIEINNMGYKVVLLASSAITLVTGYAVPMAQHLENGLIIYGYTVLIVWAVAYADDILAFLKRVFL